MAEPLPTSLLLPAPAKLNLFLHITGRRADGYHELQTLFQLLDSGDWLELTALAPGAGIGFDSNFPEVAPADNLVVRAARALQAATGTERGAAIRLDKRLPAGGGLGGGSSDAATTLLGLNHLWQTGLSLDQLATIGLQLGADVPVFVHGHTAWAEGVGERLQAVDLPARFYLILHPGVSVSTARVFGDKYLTRNSRPITIAAFLSRGGRNDCEAVVRKAWPEVDKAFDWLARFATPRLTGTGACLFAAFPTEAEAQAILAQLPAPWRGFVARGVNRSPLHRQLGF